MEAACASSELEVRLVAEVEREGEAEVETVVDADKDAEMDFLRLCLWEGFFVKKDPAFVLKTFKYSCNM